MATRKRSTSFRGEQNAPPVPKEIRRKHTGIDMNAIKASRTIKQTIAAQITEHEKELDVPRRLTNELQSEFEKRSHELLAVRKDDMAAFRASEKGKETLVSALSLFRYFEARDNTRTSYHELEFHMKALVDDVIHRLFADVAAPPTEGEPSSGNANVNGNGPATPSGTAPDPWADF